MTGYLVIATTLAVAVLFVLVAGLGRRALAPSAPTDAKVTTYESGVDPVGEGWQSTPVRYLAYAYLYVVFAVDAIYLFPWALVARSELGVASLVEVAIFIGIVLIGLVFAARRGLLEWDRGQ